MSLSLLCFISEFEACEWAVRNDYAEPRVRKHGIGVAGPKRGFPIRNGARTQPCHAVSTILVLARTLSAGESCAVCTSRFSTYIGESNPPHTLAVL